MYNLFFYRMQACVRACTHVCVYVVCMYVYVIYLYIYNVHQCIKFCTRKFYNYEHFLILLIETIAGDDRLLIYRIIWNRIAIAHNALHRDVNAKFHGTLIRVESQYLCIYTTQEVMWPLVRNIRETRICSNVM